MKEIKLDKNNQNAMEEAVGESRRVLEEGGVIVFPTDTIYGLGANALEENAILKIYKIKQRDINKPISVLVRDIQMARKIACIDSRAEEILKKIWPASITVILRKKDIIPYVLTGGEENVALRISENEFIRKLFEKIDFPLTATSANLAGEPNLLKSEDIRQKFADTGYAPDLFVDEGDLENRLPSTIIDLTDVKNPRLVRMGMIEKNKLEAFFKNFTE